MTSPLERLEEQVGVEFAALHRARKLTSKRVKERSKLLAPQRIDDDVTVVLMGSWGRRELTSESDDDYMVLVRGKARDKVRPSIKAVKRRFGEDPNGFKAPGSTNIFGQVVYSADLVGKIGLDRDDNRNMTRRMLLMLESTPLVAPDVHAAVVNELIAGYLDDSVKAYRPPRFLLNDIVRYWRTIGVDFVAKQRMRKGEGWGLRNIKLRTSRKMLFAGGLLPVLRCHEHSIEDMRGFLLDQFAMPPLDRVAEAFVAAGRLHDAVATLDAYDRFIGLLDDPKVRGELEAITGRGQADASDTFQAMTELARQLDEGLRELLYSPALEYWTKRYGVL